MNLYCVQLCKNAGGHENEKLPDRVCYYRAQVILPVRGNRLFVWVTFFYQWLLEYLGVGVTVQSIQARSGSIVWPHDT